MRFVLRLGAIVVLLVVVLGTVMVVRTLTLAPQRAAQARLAAQSDVAPAIVAQHLGEAIRIATVSYQPGSAPAGAGDGFADFRNWIAKTYPAFSAAATRESFGNALLYEWKGSDPALAPILLMSHMDVVPVAPGSEPNWKHPPFSGAVADGYVWGRGAIDCKGSLIAILEAANAVAAKGFRPARSVFIAIGADEELGGDAGNARIAEALKARGIRLEFVDDEGGMLLEGLVPGIKGPVAMIGVAEKGSLDLKLTAHGKGGHSSMPPQFSVIRKLADAVIRVSDSPFDSTLDPITRREFSGLAPAAPFGERLLFANLWLTAPLVERILLQSPASAAELHTTIAPTIISGGVKSNVLPPDAFAVVNFRLHPRDSAASALAHVRAAIDDPAIEITELPGTREASQVSDMDGAPFQSLSALITRSFPDAVVVPDLVVGGTDARHYEGLSHAVYRFIPLRVTAEELEGFHGTNERVRVSSLSEAVGFYEDLLRTATR